jgi:transposase InsO family protein
MTIDRPHRVWAADMIYIPSAGFFCLVAIMDCANRVVLSRRLSDTYGLAFWLAALEGGASALPQAADLQHRPGQPVSPAWPLPAHSNAPASKNFDGRPRPLLDYGFVERLWLPAPSSTGTSISRATPMAASCTRGGQLACLLQQPPPGAEASPPFGRVAAAPQGVACGQRERCPHATAAADTCLQRGITRPERSSF